MKSNLLIILCGLCVTGLANAECPSNLSSEELVKCQGIEKSGTNYQQWKEAQKDMADQSTISPITGKDIRSMSPAAGKAKTELQPAK